jgi:spermidine synthase
MSNIYLENNIQEFGVSHIWNDTTLKDAITTSRGTKVEMIMRPKWGLACYMDNSIQSCEIDEKLYHEALVHPVMSSVKKRDRVMIIGGGEGATAREVLKWQDVKHVDMYEWDEDVVIFFKKKYPQWAKGAWYDSRLKLHIVNIFEAIKDIPKNTDRYDVIIIDLFDPCQEQRHNWLTLIKSLHSLITHNGSIVMYAGMRNILSDNIDGYKDLINMIKYVYLRNGRMIEDLSLNKEIIPYRIFIPSFSGESMFLLLRNPLIMPDPNFEEAKKLNSHITQDIWNSYKTLNW